MISLRAPRAERVAALVEGLASAPFSYPEVGATRAQPPAGYSVDRYSAVLGHGDAVFEAARQALRAWVPFRQPWIRVHAGSEPRPDVLAAVVVRAAGLWWTNVSRVVYCIDEADAFGFAYGTLPVHAERGEERFLVERAGADARVTYSVLAFSRPRHPLARLGYPFARAAQRRFGAGSIEAMRVAVSEADA